MLDQARIQLLRDAALKALTHAHAPYSGFAVGAALLDSEGKVHSGCNVENASFGLSVCAERTAIFKAVSEGVRSFEAIAIATRAPELTPPCGACRQVLQEFAPQLAVVLVNEKGDTAQYQLSELMPFAFTDFREKEK
ncbi:MAG TPA: cytidine deaminase [Candidatus Krumholzibacteria bacterium]|nr:cytidine deaminase [Candidatus Krumholzibacteria bacterium]